MLDPYTTVLRQCIVRSPSKHVVLLAVKCAAFVIRSGVPSLASELPLITKQLFRILAAGGSSDIVHNAFRTLAVIVRSSATVQLQAPQIKMLLSFVEAEIMGSNRQNVAFALLKAIVAQRHLLSEVYDLMPRVAELLVQSAQPHVQSQCAAVFLQFLLDYPLDKKRLEQHLGFLLNNLQYAHPTGRRAVLELLHTVVLKFPAPVVVEHAELFLLPLVLQLVNDDSAQCRAMVAQVIKQLISRVVAAPAAGGRDSMPATASSGKQGSLDSFMHFALKWMGKQQQPALQRAGVQVAGLAAEVAGPLFQKYISPVFTALVPLLLSAAPVSLGVSPSTSSSTVDDAPFRASSGGDHVSASTAVSSGSVSVPGTSKMDDDLLQLLQDDHQIAVEDADATTGNAFGGESPAADSPAEQAWRVLYVGLLCIEKCWASMSALTEKEVRRLQVECVWNVSELGESFDIDQNTWARSRLHR